MIFIKGAEDHLRHSKMQELVKLVSAQLTYKRFGAIPELVSGVYAALVTYLESREFIHAGPFDAAACDRATLEDLDEEGISRFVKLARRARGFPLPEEAEAQELLSHLSLMYKGKPTNAAILLFGKQPQRFIFSSEVKCAHFHGIELPNPFLSYHF